jgi:hypothetical protein
MRLHKGTGLSILWADVPDAAADELAQWAAREPIDEVETGSGILSVGRYVAVAGGPTIIEVYELTTAEAAGFNECRRLQDLTARALVKGDASLSVGVYEQIFPPFDERNALHGPPPALQIGRIGIPAIHEDEFNEWYNTEYLVNYLKVPGVYSARRYRALAGALPYLTVYELAHDEVSRQPEWDRVRGQSIWRRRIERLWTHAPGSPGIYRRVAAR